MKMIASAVMGVAMLVGAAATLRAEDQVTLKGKITCAKCDLAVDGVKSCATVIVVEKDGKDVVYYFDKDSHKKHHGEVCKAGKPGEVTGTVKEDDGKKVIAVKEVKFKS